MRKLALIISFIILNFCVADKVIGAITDSTFYGFTVKFNETLSKSPDAVYKCIMEDVGKWWNSEHTFSGKSQNLYMDVSSDGCLCEKLGKEGFVKHMTVVFADPGKVLRLTGGLGPLQAMAVTGTLTFLLAKEGTGTKLSVIYTVGGYTPGGLTKMAGPVDLVLGEQVSRFRDYCGK